MSTSFAPQPLAPDARKRAWEVGLPAYLQHDPAYFAARAAKLFGVAPDGTVSGQEVSDKTRREIAAELAKFEPVPCIEQHIVGIPGTRRKAVAFHADPQPKLRPFFYDGRAWRRIQSATSRMPQEEVRRLLLEPRGFRSEWETRPVPGLSLDDLDREEILRTVRTGIREGRLPESAARMELPEFLDRIQVRENGVLLNAVRKLSPDTSPRTDGTVAGQSGRSQRGSQKSSQKSSQKILEALRGNSATTSEELAKLLGISRRAVAKHLVSLQDSGRLKRIGPDNGGHWKVIDP